MIDESSSIPNLRKTICESDGSVAVTLTSPSCLLACLLSILVNFASHTDGVCSLRKIEKETV